MYSNVVAKSVRFETWLVDIMVCSSNDNSLLLGMIAYLEILISFAVLIQMLLEEVLISDDVVHEMVIKSIEKYDLPP